MSVVTGVDLDAEQARSNAADAATAALNQREVDAGVWTQAQADAANANMAAGNVSTGANDVVGAVTDEAEAGLQEGLHNVLAAPGEVVGAVGSGASTLLWGIIKNIPWWVWLAGAGALFVWMGGLELLRGRLKRA
jgi:hypothetical protein